MAGYSRIWKAVVCLSACLLLVGCWSRVEINDRAFATMMYIDKGEKEGSVKLSLSFPLPNRLISSPGGGTSGTEGNPYDVVTKEGENMAAAYRLIQSDLSRKINWAQLRVILIGEEMAKTGTKPLLEFLTREPNFHLKANVFIVQGEASKLKKAAIVFERVPSEIFREFAKQGFIVNATLKDLLVARYYGNDTIIGMLVSGEKEKVSEKNKKEIWFGTGGAVLIRDGKLAAKLNVKEMRGALWILNELKGAIITIDSPSDGGKISFLAELKSTKIVPKTSKDKIVFHITCLARDEIVSIDSNLKATDPHQYEVLTRALSGEVEERMKRVLNKSKEIGADSFGLGRYLEWNYPKEWKRIKDHWDTVYKEQVEFDVHAIIEVKHKGSIGKSPWTRWAG